MDIKKIVMELVGKISKDDDLLDKFKANAKATVKKLINVDIPDDALDTVITAVKAKVLKDNISDMTDKLGDLFGKDK